VHEEILNPSNQSPAIPPGPGPSDCYQFGKLKGGLAGHEFDFAEQLLLAIREATDSIGRAELESVFGAWERTSRDFIQMKGDYFT
jgi:hypothetical protein